MRIIGGLPRRRDHKVDYVDTVLLYLISLDPEMNQIHIASTIYSVLLRLQ